MNTERMHAGAVKPLYQTARNLRNTSTQAESVLWGYLKSKPLGYKFRRQHPYSIYILDFYCHRLKLVIEVDGSIHKIEEVMLNDKLQQQFLERAGMKVVRFTNDQILKELESVITELENFLKGNVLNY